MINLQDTFIKDNRVRGIMWDNIGTNICYNPWNNISKNVLCDIANIMYNIYYPIKENIKSKAVRH